MQGRLSLALSTALIVMLAACSAPQSQPPLAPRPESPRTLELKSEALNLPQPQRAGQAAASDALHEPSADKRRAMPAMGFFAQPYCCSQPQPEDRENYARISSNAVQRVAENPVSTFSIDVDTGAYANVRRYLKQGRLPPEDAVRVEEMVNYFDYAYMPPRDLSTPFSVLTETAQTPWNPKTRLLHIGVQGWKPGPATNGQPLPSNLVFLVDVSGSMQDANKLPLVKSALKLLTRQLSHADRISLVVYAGNSGTVLEPTPGNETAKISAALDRLEAGGSTNGGQGIELAYAMAQQAYIRNGNNRVLLATDGDFNVGTTHFERLIDLVEEKRKSGIALTTLGFGEGNYNDRLMEQLADAGNGNYAYIDTLSEAQKVLVDQRDATLRTIASDVKIQVEFNPALVSEYRLIGYKNRLLKREDFSNDKVDAGEIGAGHSVTALYEISLAGSEGQRIEPLRYQSPSREDPDTAALPGRTRELAYVRLRYKRPQDGMQAASRLIEQPVRREDAATGLDRASEAFRLAAAVAGFGQLLRGGTYMEGFHYTDVEQLARKARGEDPHGYAGELLQLVKLADGLSTQQAHADLQQDQTNPEN